MPWKDPMELLSKLGDFLLEKVLIIVPVVVISLIAIKIIMKLVDRMLGRLPLEDTIKSLIRTAVKVLLLAVAAIVLMSCLEIPVTSFVALLSVVGLALSLSIQNFLSNVFAGLQLLASKPFKVGDYVDAGNCSGTVYEIGLFYTKLTSVDNKLIQLPNSTIVGFNVVNYSSQTHRRVEIKVTASYDAPTDKVKGVLSRLVEENPMIDHEKPVMVRVNAYQDSAIEYIIRVWCANDDYWTVHYDLLEAIKPAFDANEIEMTYPHLNVHMMKEAGEETPGT